MTKRTGLGVAALLLGACAVATLDPFLYDPLPAPAGGYQLSTAIIPAHEDLFVATPDGERLHVAFIPAAAPNPGGTAIIYFHGQSNNVGSTWPRLELLYPLGLPIYAVDVRGYGLSTGSPSESGITIDLRVLSDFFSAHRALPPERRIVYGRSLGGAFATHLATIAPPRALVTESTFTSIAALVADGAYAPLPVSFVAESRWDNLAKIKTLATPYLNLHGTADPYVKYPYAEALIAAHPGRHHLEAVPGADHGDVPDRLGHERYRALIRDFVGAQ
jgi:fermentation-respiration switch protein FrsA (DUF1100 family)